MVWSLVGVCRCCGLIKNEKSPSRHAAAAPRGTAPGRVRANRRANQKRRPPNPLCGSLFTNRSDGQPLWPAAALGALAAAALLRALKGAGFRF